MHTHTLATMDLEVKALGGARLVVAWNYPLAFDSKEPFWACLPYQTGFFPFFVLAIITPLEVFNKRQRLAIYLFLLAVPSSTGALLSQGMQRGGWLIVNFQPGAHLSPPSLRIDRVQRRCSRIRWPLGRPGHRGQEVGSVLGLPAPPPEGPNIPALPVNSVPQIDIQGLLQSWLIFLG